MDRSSMPMRSRLDGAMTLRRSFARLVLLLVSSCLAIGEAGAVCLLDDYSVEGEYARSAAVVEVSVLSERVLPETSDPDELGGTLYNVKVLESFRGQAEPTLVVYSENSSARFPLVKGQQYLLFLYEDVGRLSADYCGNSGLASEKQSEIATLRALKKAGSEGQKRSDAVSPSHSTMTALSSGLSHLVPCVPFVDTPNLHLELRARSNTLLGLEQPSAFDSRGELAFRMYVGMDHPPYTESVVSVYLPDSGDAVVESVESTKSIWYSNTKPN